MGFWCLLRNLIIVMGAFRAIWRSFVFLVRGSLLLFISRFSSCMLLSFTRLELGGLGLGWDQQQGPLLQVLEILF